MRLGSARISERALEGSALECLYLGGSLKTGRVGSRALEADRRRKISMRKVIRNRRKAATHSSSAKILSSGKVERRVRSSRWVVDPSTVKSRISNGKVKGD